MRKILIILMLICNISTFSQKLGHAYHFDFDNKCYSKTGDFKDWRGCQGCSMNLYDEKSMIIIDDTELGKSGFIVSKVERDEEYDAWLFTWVGKDKKLACTVVWQKEYITVIIDNEYGIKYHIAASHEEEH